jgi:hypothetical protein
VPVFPDTPEGNAEQFTYYETHKLDSENTWLDYHDVIHGRDTRPSAACANKAHASAVPALPLLLSFRLR